MLTTCLTIRSDTVSGGRFESNSNTPWTFLINRVEGYRWRGRFFNTKAQRYTKDFLVGIGFGIGHVRHITCHVPGSGLKVARAQVSFGFKTSRSFCEVKSSYRRNRDLREKRRQERKEETGENLTLTLPWRWAPFPPDAGPMASISPPGRGFGTADGRWSRSPTGSGWAMLAVPVPLGTGMRDGGWMPPLASSSLAR